jgi:hypothetical protein
MLGHRALSNENEMQEKKQMYLWKLLLPAKRMATLKEAKMSYLFGRISLDFLNSLIVKPLVTCQLTNVEMNQHSCGSLTKTILLFIGLAYQGKDIVYRFIIEYTILRDFGPLGSSSIFSEGF